MLPTMREKCDKKKFEYNFKTIMIRVAEMVWIVIKKRRKKTRRSSSIQPSRPQTRICFSKSEITNSLNNAIICGKCFHRPHLPPYLLLLQISIKASLNISEFFGWLRFKNSLPSCVFLYFFTHTRCKNEFAFSYKNSTAFSIKVAVHKSFLRLIRV